MRVLVGPQPRDPEDQVSGVAPGGDGRADASQAQVPRRAPQAVQGVAQRHLHPFRGCRSHFPLERAAADHRPHHPQQDPRRGRGAGREHSAGQSHRAALSAAHVLAAGGHPALVGDLLEEGAARPGGALLVALLAGLRGHLRLAARRRAALLQQPADAAAGQRGGVLRREHRLLLRLHGLLYALAGLPLGARPGGLRGAVPGALAGPLAVHPLRGGGHRLGLLHAGRRALLSLGSARLRGKSSRCMHTECRC